MGFKALISGGMLVLVASAAMGQSLDPVRIEMLRSILKGNNCVLTEAQAGNILPRFNFDRAETRAIVGAMVAAGEVRLDGSTLNLVDGSCSSGNDVASLLGQPDVQQFVAIMSENGCEMTEAEGEQVFTARGFSQQRVGAIIGPMIEAGIASFDSGRGLLSVSSAYCSPVMAEVEAPVEAPVQRPVQVEPMEQVAGEIDRSGMFGLTQVRGLVDLMAQNGCTVNLQNPDTYIAEAGIDQGYVSFIGRKMLSDGFASMADGQNLVLSAPYCIANGAAPVLPVEQAPAVVTPPAQVTVPVAPGMSAESVQVMGIFNAVGCTIPVVNAQALFDAAGMTQQNALTGLGAFIASGQVTVGAQGEFVAGPDICDPEQALVAQPAQVVENTQNETPTPVIEAPDVVEMMENDGSPEGIFMAVMSQNGCALSEAAARDLMPAAGVRMDQAFRIADALVAAGNASYADGGTVLQISSAICAQSDGPAAIPLPEVESEQVLETPLEIAPEMPEASVEASDPRAGVLAMLAANNCEVSQSNVGAMIGAAGLEFGPTIQMLSQMMADGTATSPDGGQTLQVAPPLCVVASAAPVAAATPRDIFINLIKQNNCSITASEFSSLLPVEGLDASTAFGLIGELEAEGFISLPPTRDTVTLSAEMCR